ncbi:MAG: hypothetical protein NTV25_04480 [Methanothrix sp.]|nr:hypothetical protein [Methanothrix sp.]
MRPVLSGPSPHRFYDILLPIIKNVIELVATIALARCPGCLAVSAEETGGSGERAREAASGPSCSTVPQVTSERSCPSLEYCFLRAEAVCFFSWITGFASKIQRI